jgi:outer membrane protein OmpA-like peptidoglycan-associated protein
MLKNKIKLLMIAVLCAAMTGCLGMGGLSHKQVKVLKKQGFVLTEDGWSLGLPERILFQFDHSEISTENQLLIKNLSDQLKKYDLTKLRINGHTDNVGNEEYNLKLSEKRAQSVADIFIANNFKAENIQVVGKGSSQPIKSEDTDESRAENRRVSITIIP